ncbi:hypothetical protein BV898_18811 [Hypsibius exemplaris]|uniref:Uncharacterized protein n=1 Tax=Hypsibius exemplaris TaxID=2072580 RepID=A0A9X6NIF3_HYPEX|nr:hypothetical protein BV898_18811 [Hypsibius exemplaris]
MKSTTPPISAPPSVRGWRASNGLDQKRITHAPGKFYKVSERVSVWIPGSLDPRIALPLPLDESCGIIIGGPTFETAPSEAGGKVHIKN